MAILAFVTSMNVIEWTRLIREGVGSRRNQMIIKNLDSFFFFQVEAQKCFVFCFLFQCLYPHVAHSIS